MGPCPFRVPWSRPLRDLGERAVAVVEHLADDRGPLLRRDRRRDLPQVEQGHERAGVGAPDVEVVGVAEDDDLVLGTATTADGSTAPTAAEAPISRASSSAITTSSWPAVGHWTHG